MWLKKTKHLLLIWVLTAGCSSSKTIQSYEVTIPKTPSNVILMIGDGMGLTQITAAMYENGNKTILEEFPVIGFHKSHAIDNLITDSAAGATAFACGEKTNVGEVGMNKDTVNLKTILEEAESNGLATGLVATSTIVHATPAAFIAHQDSREKYEEIALDFLNVEIDLFIGGGKKYFDNREMDDRDLYKELQEKGYYVNDYFNMNFEEVEADPAQNFVYFTANKHPVPAAAGREYLPDASDLAVRFLAKRSKKGFFLMIEGSQIDWAGHGNDSEMIISEVLDFKKAIKKVLSFAKKRDDTLVIITADHETGGYAINPGSTFNEIIGAFNTNGHTAALVPVFAYGPSAHLFSGIYENTAIHAKMKKALGFETPNILSAETMTSKK